MLLDLRSLVEADAAPAVNPHLIGTIGRRLKPPDYRHTFHLTGTKVGGWTRLRGERTRTVTAAAVARVGTATTVTVRLRPRPEAVPEVVVEAVARPVVTRHQLREVPQFVQTRKQVSVKAVAESRMGSTTSARRRLGGRQLVDEDDEMLIFE